MFRSQVERNKDGKSVVFSTIIKLRKFHVINRILSIEYYAIDARFRL